MVVVFVHPAIKITVTAFCSVTAQNKKTGQLRKWRICPINAQFVLPIAEKIPF
jgi:hypothetical protein